MLFFYRLRMVLLLFVSVASFGVSAKNNQLIFSVNAPGTKPYLYFDDELASYQGVVVDFFASIESDNAFEVIYLDTSRTRYEQTLKSKKADLFLSARDWLRDPDAFFLTDALTQHNSHLYATRQFDADFDLKAIEPITICTRSNFVYPVLTEFFNTDKLIRLDSTNQSTMTAMLLKGRCRYLISGKDDAHAELFSSKYCKYVFFESAEVISSVNMVFVVRQDQRELVEILNSYINKFISSGKRDESFRRHLGNQNFPKHQCSTD